MSVGRLLQNWLTWQTSSEFDLDFWIERSWNFVWYGKCEECKQGNTGGDGWCNACNAKRFQQNFKNWTSGNDDIDKFIQDIQLSAKEYYKVLEWIPYDKFYNIEYITKVGFNKIYKAKCKWIDGFITEWDNKNQKWKRWGNMDVALKIFNDSDVTLEFINEVTLHHKVSDSIIGFYGITQDPETKSYIMVLDYAENGNLRNYLNKNFDKLNWKDKIGNLLNIAIGLNEIHVNELIHRNLHSGNILHNKHYACIDDMRLCKPAVYNESENTKVYGVLPYTAPEILQGQNHTKAADIYSFGIIMYEVISGLSPYHDISHNEILVLKICKGLRPRFNIKVPQLIDHLIKKCLDADPLKRPTALEVKMILFQFQLDDELKRLEETELKTTN
ncbi:kinase-like domain-containing protein [Glomus cerebriforme]|uniref:Kinase-like domain-containing protein n=1 Tax=Glomus cerebriforme TaxID=658196 RepID=A0A397TEV4_9GLOM|nr:kinase-like domain-containing protein [Glomus cerebriforme]